MSSVRAVLSLVAVSLLCSLPGRAQDAEAPPLAGRIEGKTYTAGNGAFKMSIPVLPELGGDITDTPNVVTFQDEFNVYVSVAAFPQDATQRWELSTRGIREYLIYFFREFVLPDFKASFEGVRIESAKFNANQMDGSLITYLVIPGGTMFPHRVPQITGVTEPPLAKRGNLLFVKNGHIFIISVELAEKSIEGRAYAKTTAEEDEILRVRLNEVLNRMQFPRPATDKK